jgi:hypothetical protein
MSLMAFTLPLECAISAAPLATIARASSPGNVAETCPPFAASNATFDA